QSKPLVDKPLPERVQHLLAAIPISSEQRTRPKAKHSDEDQDLADLDASQNGQSQQNHGGLGKIISSLGNLLGGGGIGGYPMQSGAFVTDPRTGFIVDQYTGKIIDPNTGAVVGSRPVPLYGGGAYAPGLGNYGSFGTFGNGFSPWGSPYGFAPGM